VYFKEQVMIAQEQREKDKRSLLNTIFQSVRRQR